ncbi:MAG: hypothetical protein AAFR65_00580 [Pseudomonadota bacterium]
MLLLGLILLLILVWLFAMTVWLPQDHCSFWTEPPFGSVKLLHAVYALYGAFAVIWLVQLRSQSWIESALQALLIFGFVVAVEGMIAVTADPERPAASWVVDRVVPPPSEWERYVFEEFPQTETTCGLMPPRR